MYIYVYFHRSATWNMYCYDALHPTLLPTPSITSDLQEVAYASLFIRTWGNTWFVICVQRREHIFSYASYSTSYIHPYVVVDVFFTLEILRFGGKLL